MKPRGLLMIEHRLIEKFLNLIGKELSIIQKNKKVNGASIDKVVDFIRVYADRTHHGKEEDILFKRLENKDLNSSDKKLMQDLINEHAASRKAVRELTEANNNYMSGGTASIGEIIEKLSFLVTFYPQHIRKEDKEFFPSTEKYFSGEELDSMLKDFREFDGKMIHEKYNNLYNFLSENMSD